MNKILICDPDEGIKETLKLILGDYFELILTDSIDQCSDCLKHAGDIKLLFISIGTSEDFNAESVKELKGKYANLKIIAISGYKKTAEAQEAVRFGASGYVVKPFKADEILATVRSHLK